MDIARVASDDAAEYYGAAGVRGGGVGSAPAIDAAELKMAAGAGTAMGAAQKVAERLYGTG
jgi:hypothetical protein